MHTGNSSRSRNRAVWLPRKMTTAPSAAKVGGCRSASAATIVNSMHRLAAVAVLPTCALKNIPL